MTHLKKKDTGILGILQASSGNGDDPLKALLRHTVPQSVLIVVGIDNKGFREVLGVWCADSESEASWSKVFRELKERGFHGVNYVVSDDHKGLTKAIAHQFQGAVWQRCASTLYAEYAGLWYQKRIVVGLQPA